MTAILSRLDDFDSVMATAILFPSGLGGIYVIKNVSEAHPAHGDVYVIDHGITAQEVNGIRAKTGKMVYVFDHHPKTCESFGEISSRTLKIKKYKNSMELALEYAIENNILSQAQIPAAMILSQASEKDHIPTTSLLSYVYYVMNHEDEVMKYDAARRLLNFERMVKGTADAVEKYEAYRKYADERAKEAKSRKQLITLESGITCAVVNADSDVTDAIACDLKKEHDLIVVWRVGFDGKVVAQFRSSMNIARKHAQEMGGEGHYNSAGAVVNFQKFAEKYLGFTAKPVEAVPEKKSRVAAVVPANEKHARSVKRILGEFHGILENSVADLFGGEDTMKRCIAEFRHMNTGNDEIMKCLLFCNSFTASHAAGMDFDTSCYIAQANMNELCKTLPRRISRCIRLNDFEIAIRKGDNHA
jgi:hypothetical protein